jgi:hypothetical protein
MPELTSEILDWRVSELETLGLDHNEAIAVAEARDSTGNLTDIGTIRKAAENGATPELLLAIFV